MKIIVLVLILYNFGMIITKNKNWKLKIPSKIKVFNLGSSHGYFSFNYQKINGGGCNLANPSQTFYYDYKMLLAYYNNIEKKSICFLPISYFSFSERKYWTKEDKMIYLKILPFKLLDKEDRINAIILRYFPLIYSIIKRFKKKKEYKKGEDRINGHVKILEKQNEKESLEFLDKIIKKLKEKNIRIILITTPFRNEYNKYFSQELLNKNFYGLIKKIQLKHNVEYYDFSHSTLFDKDEYFNDYDHLNKKGSEIFMKEIEKIIERSSR